MKSWLTVLLMSSGILNAAWNLECISAKDIAGNPALIQQEQKIIDYLKNSWCSEEKAKLLFELVVDVQPTVCVEIGAFTGSSTVPMLAGLQYVGRGYAYIIDAWSNEEAIRGLPEDDPNVAWWSQLDMQAIKKQFIHTMKHWSLTPYFKMLHMSSEKAVSQVPFIDFLHIDGNFSEEGALLDCQLYLPKVVQGGYILLSNALVMVRNKPTKMKALWPLFEQCDIVCEIENGNALLFRKD